MRNVEKLPPPVRLPILQYFVVLKIRELQAVLLQPSFPQLISFSESHLRNHFDVAIKSHLKNSLAYIAGFGDIFAGHLTCP